MQYLTELEATTNNALHEVTASAMTENETKKEVME